MYKITTSLALVLVLITIYLLSDQILISTVERNKNSSVKFVLMLGADPNVTDVNGHSALSLARKNQNIEIIEGLIDAGANINTGEEVLETLILWAVAANNINFVKKIIAAGGNIEITDESRRNALMYAAYKKNVEIAKVLLSSGANCNTKDNEGRTALMYAAMQINDRGFLGRMMPLVESNKKDEEAFTDYMQAVIGEINKPDNMVKVLIASGADVNAIDNEDTTVLMYAVAGPSTLFSDHEGVFETLINAGANIGATNKSGGDVLQTAIRSGHVDIVSKLIKLGANVNIKTEQGMRAYVEARESGNSRIFSLVYDAMQKQPKSK